MAIETIHQIKKIIAEVKVPPRSAAIETQVRASHAQIARACQLNGTEKDIFLVAIQRTGDVYTGLSEAYKVMHIERKAAIALALLKQGFDNNLGFVLHIGSELKKFLAEQPNGPQLNLFQVISDPKNAIRKCITGAVERVRSLDAGKMAALAGKFPALLQLCEILGIDGQGLLTHIAASPDKVIPELEILVQSALDGSHVAGLSPKTVELITPWQLMSSVAQRIAEENHPAMS